MTTQANKARLILALRSAGITDTAVLSAIERVPRELFVPETFRDQAYEDTALPIGYGQTLSQPLVVTSMVAALQLDKRMKLFGGGNRFGLPRRHLGATVPAGIYDRAPPPAAGRSRAQIWRARLAQYHHPRRRRYAGMARAGAVRTHQCHRRRCHAAATST